MPENQNTPLDPSVVVNIPSKQDFLSEIKKLSDEALNSLSGMINDIIGNANLPQSGVNAYVNKQKMVEYEQALRDKANQGINKASSWVQSMTGNKITAIQSRSKAIATGMVVGGIGGYVLGKFTKGNTALWAIGGAVAAAVVFVYFDKQADAPAATNTSNQPPDVA